VLDPDLRTQGSDHLAELKPRVTQPSRLDFSLMSAVDDAQGTDGGDVDPVCGWVIANRLDRSLAFYERDGTPRGELLLADRMALWFAPPNLSPPPGAAPAPVEIGNRHLRAIVLGVLGAADSARALEGLLALLDEAAWATAADRWADGALPLLIGQPIAVLRARLAFSLSGLPATSQRWDDTGRGLTGGFEHVRFPIRLGSTELLDDGLVGFYLNDDYGAIASPYRLAERNDYVTSALPSLAMDGAGALLTMLAAPGGRIHAFTGILPPAVIELPSQYVTPELSRMQITFRGGPAINDAAGAVMPLPSVDQGAWSWLQYENATSPASERAVAAGDGVAQLPDPAPLVREGWLRLVLGAAPTRLAYTVSPSAVAAAQPGRGPSTVILQLSVYNGSGDDVACSGLRFTLPVGPGEHDLTERPDLIEASLPAGAPWTVQRDGGEVLARPIPPLPGLARGETLRITLAGVRINAALGAAAITVQETTGEVRQTALLVNKVSA
jgi:hypothetical protein